MQNREDILEGARSLRPLLEQLVGGAAGDIDAKLADLLEASQSAKVDNQILELVAENKRTREWMREFLEVAQSSNEPQRKERLVLFISRHFDPLRGDVGLVPAERFECPRGDYVWYRPSAGATPPKCPTHNLALLRVK